MLIGVSNCFDSNVKVLIVGQSKQALFLHRM